jgi:subtilisin family serine protease
VSARAPLVALAAALLAAIPLAARAGEADSCPFGQTIVLLREGVDADAAAQALSIRYRGVVCRVYRHSIRGVTLRCAGPNVRAALEHDPLVRAVEPDVRVRAFDGQVVPTGMRRIGLDHSPLLRLDGKDRRVDVGVAVIDTGIDARHPDLQVVKSVSFVASSPKAEDGNGHGTHCAGIIGALDNGIGVVGVAPGARLYAVKVLADDGSGSLSDVIAGVDWVAEHAAEIAVANMSLGVAAKSESLHAAIAAAVHAGVVFVAAAGNEAEDVFGEDGIEGTDDDSIPAAYPEVCAVSALADTDGQSGGLGPRSRAGPDDTLASFSNFSRTPHKAPRVRSPGGAIDLAAPGVDILSTWPGGRYATLSGTSMAAPHVAGLAALAIARRGRDWTGDGKVDERDVYAVRQALIDAAEPQSHWRADGAMGSGDHRKEGLASALLDLAPRLAAGAPGRAPEGVYVVATLAPADLGPGEPGRVVVGVRNGGAREASFEVVLLDATAGRGLARRAVHGLAAGHLAILTIEAPDLEPAHALRAVIVAEGGARAPVDRGRLAAARAGPAR